MVAVGLVLASVLALATAKSSIHRMVLHDHRDSIPKGFVLKGPASPSTTINLRLALKSRDIKGLEKALYEVSDPKSAKYGKHLSKEEVEAFVTPTSETTSAVHQWLSSNNLKASKISPAGDWLGFDVEVKKANDLLRAEFTTFTHQETGKDSIRTLSYSLPAHLKGCVDFVYPTTIFPKHSPKFPSVISPLPHKGNLTTLSRCSSVITPACLRSLYGIPKTKAVRKSNKLGVTGFIGEHAQKSDLKRFLQMFRPDLSSKSSFTVQTLDGGTNTQGSGQTQGEANLDIQYTVGVASNVPTIFISVGEDNQDGVSGFLDLINFLLSENSPPQVLTTSYGFNEGDLGNDIENNLCDAYMQLGARGVSILFASGDGGVGGSQSSSCSSFVPTFPSGCPFITSVGATTGVPETGASFSSGGFSNVFSIPDYQASFVSNYLNSLGQTNSGLFNPSGRAFPDVSAQGENVAIVLDGQNLAISGTSCSSPIFASMISLINNELAKNGSPPLGFLNPLLYSNAGAFADITSGSNPGCDTGGFPATSGWDPVTGLGTLKYAALRSAVGL